MSEQLLRPGCPTYTNMNRRLRQARPRRWSGWSGNTPSFARDSQNVATVAALLDALPTPSTDLVGKMYPWLKSIPGTTVVQQVESYLQHRSMLLSCPPASPKDGEQRAAQGALDTGTTSSPTRFLACDRLS
jgi:hypothetical protein